MEKCILRDRESLGGGPFSLMKVCFIKIAKYPELGVGNRLKSEIMKPAPFPAR